MIDKINKMIEDLKHLRDDYKEKEHKYFEVGDIITNKDIIGEVKWIKNKAIGFRKEDGFCGISLLNNDNGFMVVRNDDYRLTSLGNNYFNKNFKIELELSGKDINRLIYELQRVPFSKATDKILNKLESLKINI